MSENEVETATKEQATEPVTEKPKKAKATATKPESPTKVKTKSIVDEIMATIKNMTVLELAELVKALETEFGVSAAVPAVAATTPAAQPAEAAAEEQTEFSVTLKDIGVNKISVIKAVRELTTLGLKEAKDLVESAPVTVKEGINKDEVATIKQKLEAAGATVEIK